MRRVLPAIVVAAACVFAGCTVPPPEGAAPLRYRDAVFPAVTKTSDITYGTAPANGTPQALKLDLYQPTGDSNARRGALVEVHGGGFTSGNKTEGVPVDVANTFAKKGYVVVSINYRLLAPTSCVGNPSQPACVSAALAAKNDAQAAVRWLRANASTYRIDPTRIGIGGESAGAITATLVGLNSEEVGNSGNPGQPSTVRGFSSISGGLPDGLFADSNKDAPGLFFHGTADTVVSPNWSRATAAKMLQSGQAAWLELQDGAGHVPWSQYRSLYVGQMTNFFYLTLDMGHATGQPASAARAADRQEDKLSDKYGAKIEQRYPRLGRTYPQLTP